MGLWGGEKLVVGYDLGNEFSQISVAASGSGDVTTLSQTAGEENYNIPTVLCKRTGVNQWFYGKEAVRWGEEGQGILVDGLLELARDGEPVIIEEESYDPVALLTLFFKRSLGLISQAASADRIGALMVTCERIDHRMLEVLEQMAAGLQLKTDKIAFHSYRESFYYYMIHQPEELWVYQSLLFTCRRGCMVSYRMECNRHTVPVVTYMEEAEYPFVGGGALPEEPSAREQAAVRLDADFLRIARECCEGKAVNSIFLIGDAFDREWMQESLRYLCRNRRVFQGTNLFSKGACMGMQERLKPSEAGTNHVFLGKEKLKANVGMKILRQGEESYYALLDAGVNWYEAEAELEFYVQEGNEISLMITPLIGKNGKIAQIVLEDMPGSIARLWARFFLETEEKLAVEIQDLGFGEIRPSSGHVWREKVDIY